MQALSAGQWHNPTKRLLALLKEKLFVNY